MPLFFHVRNLVASILRMNSDFGKLSFITLNTHHLQQFLTIQVVIYLFYDFRNLVRITVSLFNS